MCDLAGNTDSTNFKYIDNTLTTAIGLLKAVIGSAYENFGTVDDRIYFPPPGAVKFVEKSSILFRLQAIRVKTGQ